MRCWLYFHFLGFFIILDDSVCNLFVYFSQVNSLQILNVVLAVGTTFVLPFQPLFLHSVDQLQQLWVYLFMGALRPQGFKMLQRFLLIFVILDRCVFRFWSAAGVPPQFETFD